MSIESEMSGGIALASRRRPASDAQSYIVGESEIDGSSEIEGTAEDDTDGRVEREGKKEGRDVDITMGLGEGAEEGLLETVLAG